MDLLLQQEMGARRERPLRSLPHTCRLTCAPSTPQGPRPRLHSGCEPILCSPSTFSNQHLSCVSIHCSLPAGPPLSRLVAPRHLPCFKRKREKGERKQASSSRSPAHSGLALRIPHVLPLLPQAHFLVPLRSPPTPHFPHPMAVARSSSHLTS